MADLSTVTKQIIASKEAGEKLTPEKDYKVFKNLIHVADESFTSESQSPTSIIDFVQTLSRYDKLPDQTTDADVDTLSFIMQECVIQRMAQIRNIGDRFLVHHMSCAIIAKLFYSAKDLARFKLQK